MKKITLFVAFFVLAMSGVLAQNAVEIAEKDVPSRNVIDFQRQSLDVRNVTWFRIDSTPTRCVSLTVTTTMRQYATALVVRRRATI